MRLLNIHTWQFLECYGEPPPYVITSHRWAPEELTYQDLSASSISSHVKQKAGYQKLVNFCKVTQRLMETCPNFKVEYLWIDTCCIDKTNAVELAEALNSMFRWYAQAEVCLAFLFDVVSLDKHPFYVMRSFMESDWHRRGWCLQELLAPKSVLFYNQDWECLGWKPTERPTPWITARVCGIGWLNAVLAEVTGIPEDVLWDFENTIETISVEEKRAWMNGRSTTRIEDKVYCQLGIFGVFMPLIYGEGEHALVRLGDALEQKRRRGRVTGSREVVESPPTPRYQMPLRAPVQKLKEEVKCHVTYFDEHFRQLESPWPFSITMKTNAIVRALRYHAEPKREMVRRGKLPTWELLLVTSRNAEQGQTLDDSHSLGDLPRGDQDELWFQAVFSGRH